ncbi:MAG TPA: septal ring lytic transglycosylase RlpA family protein [Candidatus Pseudomonas excrementavium]|uniref:septal ring lytic transglycosylase RlpA family protein n=1 Tax=Halopseudomonas bauzanensis TaxID=653930 RepID=UPI001C3B699E|nr:septal ring lytic transglycosylase RlpA family protein [Halopseudomonas bauzanensis]HIZ51339.1 septal ring lytic transglycosylase RlpA family protein [Candidatus Pseudomonas excrementavium]
MNKPLRNGPGFAVICLLLGLLSACSSSPVQQGQGGAASASKPRPAQDGAPDYFQDVSKIPDAVPVPHTGAYKASPYRVLGRNYNPMQDGRNYRESGLASWYGTKFHEQLTANGELYDLYGMTAAHKTLPLPTYVRVTNLDNDRSIIVRVNDRGPFHSDRIIDLSYAGAVKLGFAEKGVARVRVEGIDPVVWQQQNNPGYLVKAQPSAAPAAAVARPAPAAATPAAAVANAGLYLQVGAFASDQAAQQLRSQLQGMVSAPVFVTPIEQDSRTLHRVRLGPVNDHAEAERLMETLRLANLGNPSLVSAN